MGSYNFSNSPFKIKEWSSLFDSLSDMVVICQVKDDKSFTYEYINPPAQRIVSMEWIGKGIEEVHPPHYAESLSRKFHEILDTKQPARYSDDKQWGGSEEILTSGHFSPIVDETGRCTHIVVIAKDSKEELELIWNHTTDAIYLLAQDGSNMKINPAFERMFGWSEEEVKGVLLPPYLPLEFRTEYYDMIERLKAGESFVNIPQKRVHKNGKVIDLLVSYRPVNNGNILAVGSCIDVTELNRIHHALNQSKERYKKLVQFSPDAIFVISNGNLVFINPVGSKLLKADESNQLLGRSIFELISTSLQGQFIEFIRNILQGQDAGETVATQLVCLDESVIDVEVVGVEIIYNEEHSVQLVIRDISDRILAKRALEESESKYRLITENMTDLVAVIHTNGRVFYASPSHEIVLGVHQEHLVGKLIRNLVHVEDQEEVIEAFYSAVTYKEPFNVIFRMLQVNKNIWLDFEAYGTPIFGEDGELESFVLLSRNITDRKQTEAALKESEEKYRLIAENMSDLIAILDIQGFIRYASPSYHSILGFPTDHIEGDLAFNMVHPDDTPTLQKTFFEIILDKAPRGAEFRYKHVNGEWIYVEARFTPVLLEHDEVEYIVVVARDITDRKNNEKLLMDMAFTDTLTGLPNRRKLMDHAKHALITANRQQNSIGLLFLDIDKFKEINDKMGHDIGDELLIRFAERVKGNLKDDDIMCRIGGDEFVILLPTVYALQDATNVAEKVIQSLQIPWQINGHVFRTTSSIGIAISNAGDTIDMLLKRADKALYRVKENGRNHFKVDL
ncbi:PAS domain S-box protein [Paenibacillus frigoriresistens]|uniref:PAS domain S-box protein n=1 Tax=Paenibacillus alginolyticus TaxID=59839 RepID=UPI001565CAA9|nr:PAS domain S-box protein [Paenibacillus frigoriresistens]NRF95571.1 PAS domain S-box protein [Paenibacillus frigoriresistens]